MSFLVYNDLHGARVVLLGGYISKRIRRPCSSSAATATRYFCKERFRRDLLYMSSSPAPWDTCDPH
jgi:hypothetical protein